jgi:hypothetical protein
VDRLIETERRELDVAGPLTTSHAPRLEAGDPMVDGDKLHRRQLAELACVAIGVSGGEGAVDSGGEAGARLGRKPLEIEAITQRRRARGGEEREARPADDGADIVDDAGDEG